MAEHLLKNSATVAFMPLSLALYFHGLKDLKLKRVMFSALFGSLVVFSHASTASVTGTILTSITLYFLFKYVWRKKYRIVLKLLFMLLLLLLSLFLHF
ncbi:MAG: hypothetical protein NDF54_02050 [archaeon GB-1867-035]|nr:hypothetical protein [Candidatus Culexmicrobium profundum]